MKTGIFLLQNGNLIAKGSNRRQSVVMRLMYKLSTLTDGGRIFATRPSGLPPTCHIVVCLSVARINKSDRQADNDLRFVDVGGKERTLSTRNFVH